MTESPKTKFGYDNQGKLFDSYIGEWAIIRPTGMSTTYAGKIIGVKEDCVLLNPYECADWDVEKGMILKLNKTAKPLSVPLIGSAIEPTTQKTLENYCAYQNKINEESRKRLEEEVKKKVQ